jgi:hypothetical protein
MKKGQVVAWFEGVNHVCGVLLEDAAQDGVSMAATSLTFGAKEVDFVYRDAETKLVAFDSEVPTVLKKYL